MKRNAIDTLIQWKAQELRTPFFLYGIRNCGKTYLAMDFAKSFFEGILYVNFEKSGPLQQRFKEGCTLLLERYVKDSDTKKNEAAQNVRGEQLDGSYLVEEFYALLSECFEIPEEYLGNFLIAFDEVMDCAPVYDFMLQLAEQKWSLCLLLISSHSQGKNPSECAGKFLQSIQLTPLQFDEFLTAIGSEWYAEVIKGHYQTIKKVPGIVHNELLDLFSDYLQIGGMPAAINEYLLFRTTDNVYAVHQNLEGSLHHQIHKTYGESLALKMMQVLDVIPEQLTKENQKFQYRMIRKGATGAMYQEAIQTLLQDNMILRCCKQADAGNFKLFPADVGMFHSCIGSGVLFLADSLPEEETQTKSQQKGVIPEPEFRKELLDCYVLQALTAKGYVPEFWESASQAKIDFLLSKEEGNIPVEVKAGDNTRSKSVSIYRSQNEVPYSIKISSRNFELTNQMKYIPYYAVFCL